MKKAGTIRSAISGVLAIAWILYFFLLERFTAGLFATAPSAPNVPAGLVFELHARGNVFRYVSRMDYLIFQSIWVVAPIYIAIQSVLYYWPSKTKPAAHTEHIKGGPHETP